ncbi:hypothetical protein C8A00DRAFT_34774 [Chaetomidium leptoderma]|uniref:Uncharacterized protein n=1 Tax=Chaetomidium leptoderma TaxID=669021 RepID=A0AAN6ZWB6_9PEZI|nr:hypothetical protein C8A00DRAFT_34774 [Chaetomidium leptoderma]
MSAVKNLRAMFEQKGDTSPPDRGRSPGIPPGPGSDSPRPLSKIRTSFVAIEKDGRIGLQRGASQDSISAVRNIGGDSNVTTPTTGMERSNPFDLLTKSPARVPLQTRPIVDSPRASFERKEVVTPPQAEKAQTATAEPSPGTDTASKAPEPSKPIEKEPAPESAATPKVENTNGTGSGKEPEKLAAIEASKPVTRTAKPVPKPLTTTSASKPVTKAQKSPTIHKGPKSPAATSAHHTTPKKTPEKKAQPPEKPATPRATTTSKPAGPSSVKRPPPLQASPANTGFVKPKVKSPTRPVKLPASLTTHTASSGSKISGSRQSLSRASGTNLSADPHARPASRASGSTESASQKSVPARGLRRQSSNISRPRPSLGPPPKQPAKDHPPTKREKEVDQGFLARMMRPTASSASKTTGKVPTSPPRKTAAAASKKTATAKPLRRVVARGAASSRPQSSAANHVTAHAQHARTANDAIEKAKAAEGGEVSLPAEASTKSPAQEVAPVVEQADEVVLSQTSEAAAVEEQSAKELEPKTPEEPTADAEIEAVPEEKGDETTVA